MNPNKIRVRGVIVPSGWTDSGDVFKISILTYDEKEYQINLSQKGGELMGRINAQVEIEGKLRKRIDGRSTLYISTYRIIEPEINPTPLFHG